MAPTFGAAGTQLQTTTANPSVDVPDGVVANSVVVITGFIDGALPTITLPSGFAHAGDSPTEVIPSGGGRHSIFVCWKRASGSENTAGTYDFTLSGSTYVNIQAIRYDGCITTGDPWNVTNSAVGDVNDTVSPAVSDTTTVDESLLVWAATNWSGGAWTPPTAGGTWTERRDSGDAVCTVADKAQSVQGATGSITGSCVGSDRRTAWLGALMPVVTAVAPTSDALPHLPINLLNLLLRSWPLPLPTTGLVAVLGIASETDIAQPLGRLKTAGVGQVAETMVAQPFTVRKTRTLGQVVETAVVQPVAWAPKNRLVNQVTETSVAQPVTRRKTVAVNMVTQTNVAQPVTSRKTAVIGQVATTMVAQPVTRVKSRVINQVSETDVSQPIARLKAKLLGQVVTTMVAQTITRAGVVNRVTETEVAQPISRLKAKATGMVTTTMVSQPLARVKLRVVGMVTTTMVSQPLTRVKVRATGLVTTTALAQPMTHRKLTVVGMVAETDLGRPVRPPQRVAIGRAVETSTVGVVVWLAPILSRFPVDVSVAIDRGTVTVALTRSTVTVDMTRPVRSVEL